MTKNNVDFKFVIGKQYYNDPYIRVVSMEGLNIVETIHKTDNNNKLLALSECLRTLANHASKLAEEYEAVDKI